MLCKAEAYLQTGHFQRSLAFVAAGSGLLSAAEVSLEHYKGSYGQKIMYSPILLSLGLATAGVGGTVSPRLARSWLPVMSWALIADGVIGFGFHIRGVHRKPGGWGLPLTNIVMGPPLFAPLLLTVGGFIGVIAAKLAPEEDQAQGNGTVIGHSGATAKINPSDLRRLLALATAISAGLNGFEALYSHYKTRFEKPAQWIPIALTPPLLVAAACAVVSPKLARKGLAPVSVLAIGAGVTGFVYHVRATLRRPGFKERPFYNLIYGPPPLAPLLFAATGFLGLLAAFVDHES